MGKYRMEEPWGYIEERDYESNSQEEVSIAGLFDKVEYNKGDNKMYFYDKYGSKCGTIDVSEFEEETIVEKAYYDKETGEIVIEFVNGDVVRIDIKEVLDENEFKDGLQVNDGVVSILIDSAGEGYEGNPYLSTSESGLKISGIDKHIDDDVEAERVRAVAEEERIDAKIVSETERAEAAESALTDAIAAELERIDGEFSVLQDAIDTIVDTKANAADVETEIARATAEEAKKVDKEIQGTNGKAIIFNESDGGGAKFEHNDGTESFVGVNDGGENGLVAQIYADKFVDNKWQGAKLDVTNGGMYYTVGSDSFADRAVAANEIAVKGDIPTNFYSQEEVDALIRAKETEIYNLTKLVGEIGGNVTYTYPNELGTSLTELMKNNGTVKLTEDATISRFGPGVTAKNKVTINLNNHNLTSTGASSYGAIQSRGTEEITIGGKGTIDAGDGICIEANGTSSLSPLTTINLTGSTTTYRTNRPGGELIYCYVGIINITNGTFRNDGASEYTLNCYDANYAAGTAKIIVSGGKFYDFDPGNNNAEGPGTSFLAEGYHTEASTVIEDGVEHTVYTVKKDA